MSERPTHIFLTDFEPVSLVKQVNLSWDEVEKSFSICLPFPDGGAGGEKKRVIERAAIRDQRMGNFKRKPPKMSGSIVTGTQSCAENAEWILVPFLWIIKKKKTEEQVWGWLKPHESVKVVSQPDEQLWFTDILDLIVYFFIYFFPHKHGRSTSRRRYGWLQEIIHNVARIQNKKTCFCACYTVEALWEGKDLSDVMHTHFFFNLYVDADKFYESEVSRSWGNLRFH